jgi:hypothetical protein
MQCQLTPQRIVHDVRQVMTRRNRGARNGIYKSGLAAILLDNALAKFIVSSGTARPHQLPVHSSWRDSFPAGSRLTERHKSQGLAPSRTGQGQSEQWDPRQGQDRRSQSGRTRVWRPGRGELG